MRKLVFVDISHYSFEEFVDFLFDRDVPIGIENPPSSEERARRWYFTTKAIVDLERLNNHYIRLFEESALLLRMFSKSQLAQGLSAMLSTCDFSVKTLIWNTGLAFEQRARCVRSMLFLFRDFFSVEPLGYLANMWWDGLCYVWEMGRKQRSRGGEDESMQDVMFSTMSEILEIDSNECRLAALHGLHHLHHPETLGLTLAHRTTIPGLERWCENYHAEEAAWKNRVEGGYSPRRG